MKPSTASKEHFPVIKGAKDAYCYDVQGKEYLDFTGANLTVILGYKRYGFYYVPNFAGKSYLEDEVSNELSKFTKTKYFRYFKNGHNAVDCAIRLARHIHDVKSQIMFIGYAGTSNEYVFTFNQCGVPFQNSTQCFLDKDGNNPQPKSTDVLIFESRFIEQAKQVKAKIKICDHLKSGINGLYENIDADFHLYGKSIANGYPISIMTGKDKYMKRIDEIYYSTTYGGENTGLEAVLKTLKEYDRKHWLDLKQYADSILPSWQSITPKKIKEYAKYGILFNGYWQIMTCHTKEDIDLLAKTIKKVGI